MRQRWFWLLCAVSAAIVALYIARRPLETPPSPGVGSTTALDTLLRGPRIYVRSMRRDEYGRVAVAALDRPDEQRYVSALECDRVAFARDRGLCLVDTRARISPPGVVHTLDARFRVLQTAPLAGVPSRARVARDGRSAATTVFVSGENYASLSFSTRTHIMDLATGTALPDLEQFTAWRGTTRIAAADINYWGVTFLSSGREFLATLATGGRISLVRGDIETRTVRVVRDDVECPSLSPDGTRAAFKRRVPGTREWRLYALDVTTNREWPLAAETRSVDDQPEWLDDDHVLYGLIDERGLPDVAANVWVVSVREDNREPPRVFVRGALSPTVVR